MEKMKPTHITGTNSGKKSKDYYFFPTTDRDKAMEAAYEHKTPIPQCWDKWKVKGEIKEAGKTSIRGKVFQAPCPGLILMFEHGSPS